jgi:hypothetical protein
MSTVAMRPEHASWPRAKTLPHDGNALGERRLLRIVVEVFQVKRGNA